MFSRLENIDSGLIELNGRLLNDHNKFVEANQRKIGFVFQDNPLFPHLNVLENIKFNLNKIDDDELTKLLNLTALMVWKKDILMSYLVVKNKGCVSHAHSLENLIYYC